VQQHDHRVCEIIKAVNGDAGTLLTRTCLSLLLAMIIITIIIIIMVITPPS
jgi:hypothetical protein